MMRSGKNGGGVNDDDKKTLGDESVISDAQRKAVLVDWNQTHKPFDNTVCLHQLFERQAQLRPQSEALAFRDQSMSYAELNNKANRLALTLQALGAKPDQLIGLFIERSIEMVVGLLAILKSGAAYVPLDPSYPHDRIDLMIADSQASILLIHSSLRDRLPNHDAAVVCVDNQLLDSSVDFSEERHSLINAVTPSHLAYVIYTSGSTGIPKGVMVEHRNVLNFMAGMDDSLQYSGQPGVWLAVTSISFDISVLEIFWSLTRGFKVVIQEEDAATLGATSSPSVQQNVSLVNRKMDVGLFYFSSDAGPNTAGDRYKLLLEGSKFADSHDFSTVWTPERHFHLFGGLYPNPSVTSAAVAAVTQNVAIRAGSIVLPLHNPIRVAEEWSVVDNLSNGRVGFSFASGWHVNDFALKPENFENRRQLMFDEIETVRKLWRGEAIEVLNGEGKPFEAKIYPPAIQKEPPIWITTAGNIDTFRAAGEGGFNVLTNLLGQTIEDLTSKISAYRQGRKDKGFEGPGNVSVMVHTFIGTDIDEVRETVRAPFCHYLKTSFDLVKIAPWAFPAFKQPSKAAAQDSSFDADTLTDEDLDALIDHAFDRYFETAGLFGTATSVLPLLDQIKSAGIDEVACLIDFGVDNETVLDNLQHLNQLRINSNPEQYQSNADYSIAAQIKRHGVTHFQCTPSMARILASDNDTFSAMSNLHTVLLGGEALPVDLAKKIQAQIKGQLINVYGPTEATIWSTSAAVTAEMLATKLTIGRPIANTQIYIVDEKLQPTPIGVAGELMIGGQGVVRGYHRRAELTAEKFITNPFVQSFSHSTEQSHSASNNSQSKKADLIYRTGDLASYRDNGDIDFLGRLDHQVKLRGYRIELGEIESLLNNHAGIKNSVVIATESELDQPQSLIAYVVADKSSPSLDNSHWQSIWDKAYENGNSATKESMKLVANSDDTNVRDENSKAGAVNGESVSDPTFNISGWIDSYTGEQHLHAPMQEWVDTTVNRIMALKPKRILEIGCGTGLLLYRIAPQCERYDAIDFSATALALINQQVNALGLDNVSLINSAADNLSVLKSLIDGQETFDVVIINSVIQYFPSADYLVNVIASAVKHLSPAGQLFIGDVRHLALKNLFDTSIEFAKAPADLSVELLQKRINSHRDKESELLVAPDFFTHLKQKIPAIKNIDIQLKRGHYRTEMSAYRYDVILCLDNDNTFINDSDFAIQSPPNNLLELKAMISDVSEPMVFRDLVNARLLRDQLIQNTLMSEKPAHIVDGVKQLVDQGQQCGKGFQYANSFQPEDIYQLVEDIYPSASDINITLTWAKSGDPVCFDVYLSPKNQQHSLTLSVVANDKKSDKPDDKTSDKPDDKKSDKKNDKQSSREGLAAFCNQPIQATDNFDLIDSLKARLAKCLPDFMRPNEFVVLPSMPLTPNGKIDRNALPKPEKRKRITEDEFIAPESDIEKTIAIVFQEMLNLEKIGSKDDFFSLGANSLLIAQANNRLSQRLDKKVSLVAMYRYPTVAALAGFLSGNTDKQQSADAGVARAEQRKSAASSRRRRKSIRL